MNKIHRSAMMGLLMAWAALGLASAANAAVKPGEKAPDFSLADTKGKKISLADYRGKYVILEWTNDQCPFVQKHYGSDNMQSLQKTYTGKGHIWLTINSSAPGKQGHVTPAQADKLTASRNAVPTAVLLDETGVVGQAYGAKTTPHMYIIDPAGKLLYMGGIDNIPSADKADIATATNYVKATFADIEAGRPVAVALSQPYGCGVKY